MENIKGWRILSKTTLPESDIALLLKEMGTLGQVIHSNMGLYLHVLGQEKAQQFKEEVEKIKLSAL